MNLAGVQRVGEKVVGDAADKEPTEATYSVVKDRGFIIFFNFNFNFYFILLYNTVLVLPYIDMNQPRVYMSSQT